METRLLILKPKKNYSIVLIAIIWSLFVLVKFKTLNNSLLFSDLEFSLITLITFFIFLYLVMLTAWSFLGQTTFTIKDSKLIVRYGISLVNLKRVYILTKIANVKVQSDIKSSDYWGFQGFRFYGNNETALSFEYNNKAIVLGKGLDHFNLIELKQWLT
ncbi:hypothetical protein [Mucilaginibacter dorajii]|nr:hypothetical protein [Mucilaginibacter dorajii]MCS3737001.1 hypothetical protein [Mucilaginibacter dorajii]